MCHRRILSLSAVIPISQSRLLQFIPLESHALAAGENNIFLSEHGSNACVNSPVEGRRSSKEVVRLGAQNFDLVFSIILCLTMPGKWIELIVTYDSLEAEMIKDLLESGGIKAEIRSSKVTPYPVNMGKMGEVKVLVKEEDRAAAEEMMRDRQEKPAAGERDDSIEPE